MPSLFRITTVPISLKLLLTGQMKYMSQKSFDVQMISASGREVSEIMQKEGCLHIVVPFTRKISPLQDLKCLWKLILILRKEKPDIIHTHTPKAGLIGMLAGKICGVPIKIHTIAGLPLMTANGSKRKLLEFTEKLTYWAADYILPNSKSILSFIRENRFTKKEKLDMIGSGSSNGIDLERFSRTAIQEDKLQKVKHLINYQHVSKFILAIGRVVKDKGIIELVKAYSSLRMQFKELKLVIVGPLEEERQEELLPVDILTLIREDEGIIHINWSDEVEYYMYLADILVHASYREGFPNVPLQAGAMECPIVCSNIPGNIDIVTDKKTGLHFKVRDTDDLTEKIKYALNNYSEMKEHANRLRKEIENNYSRAYIHQELLNFYREKLALVESKH